MKDDLHVKGLPSSVGIVNMPVKPRVLHQAARPDAGVGDYDWQFANKVGEIFYS
jgi:hypothetical protein